MCLQNLLHGETACSTISQNNAHSDEKNYFISKGCILSMVPMTNVIQKTILCKSVYIASFTNLLLFPLVIWGAGNGNGVQQVY